MSVITESERKTVAYAIFHRLYLISVPEIYCQGTEVVRETGSYTTGDKKVDKAMEHNPRVRYCTIAGMCAFFEEGAPVTLMNPKNAPEIYNLVMEHLENWNWIIHNYFDCDPPPAEDFILMDEFAKSVHPVAMANGGNGKSESSFERTFRVIRGRQGSFFDRMRNVNQKDVPREVPKHLSTAANNIVRRLWKTDEAEAEEYGE